MAITKKKTFEQTDKLYEHLQEAYEMAGGLRDSFTGVLDEGADEYQLKEQCNAIRKGIYELQKLRGKFQVAINTLPEK